MLLYCSSPLGSRIAPLKTTLKCHSASSTARSSHSSLYKQGQEHGHAYTSLSVILLLCPARHLQTPLPCRFYPSPPPPTHLHLCSFAHKHSMMPVVITVGHNFRDNLKTIYYPWSIKNKQKKTKNGTSTLWMFI